jgi:hypothetical protein
MALVDDVRDLIAKLEQCEQTGANALIDLRSVALLLEVLDSQSNARSGHQKLFDVVGVDANQNCRNLGFSCDATIALAMFAAAAKGQSGKVRLLQGDRVVKEGPISKE